MIDLSAHPLAMPVAVIAAAAMGFAIQRGGTCMVAAVDQLVRDGSAKKLVALGECSLWTSALGILALAAGLGFAASPAYPVGVATLVGGLLLGLGAWLNGACVFGSIARIGGRDWHYLLTPPGFFFGCLLHAGLVGAPAMPVAAVPATVARPLLVLFIAASIGVSHRRPILSTVKSANKKGGGSLRRPGFEVPIRTGAGRPDWPGW